LAKNDQFTNVSNWALESTVSLHLHRDFPAKQFQPRNFGPIGVLQFGRERITVSRHGVCRRVLEIGE